MGSPHRERHRDALWKEAVQCEDDVHEVNSFFVCCFESVGSLVFPNSRSFRLPVTAARSLKTVDQGVFMVIVAAEDSFV